MLAKMEFGTHSCSDETCSVGIDGNCLDGISALPDCPRYRRIISKSENESIAENLDIENASKSIDQGYWLCESADGLSLEQASKVLRNSRTNVVMILGPESVGKTTMIAGVYELFQQGRLENYLFAGSKTLHAFEARCFNARVACNRLVPTTPRTSAINPVFLHIDLAHSLGGGYHKQALLLYDLAGSQSDAMANSMKELREKASVITRTDHFALVLDCMKLSKGKTRNAAKEKLMDLVERLIDSNLMSSYSQIQLIFSRWDYIQPGDDETLNFVAQIETEINERFVKGAHDCAVHQVASLPLVQPNLRAGFGLQSLIEKWLRHSAFFSDPIISTSSKYYGNLREFEKY